MRIIEIINIMATIKRTVHVGDKPSDKAIREVRDAAKRPITFDDDAPELSDEDYARMAKLTKLRTVRGDSRQGPVYLGNGPVYNLEKTLNHG